MDVHTLLSQSIVIDSHLDLLYDVALKRRQGRRQVILDDYLADWQAGYVNCVVSSIYCDEGSDYLSEALKQIAVFEEEIAESKGEFFLATCAKDIRHAHATGKVAIMLAFEGVEPLMGEVGFLRVFHKLGVRMVGLCWSRSNWAADGCRFADFEYTGYGITEKGQHLLSLAKELNMLIDISHTNEIGFWQVVKGSTQPVLASHSNCRAISNTPRNLDDKQIAAIAQSGGYIGINGVNLVALFQDKKNATIATLVNHMRHIREVAGTAACLGIGFDQCDRINAELPDELNEGVFDIMPNHTQLPDLVDALLQSDFSEEEIQGILGGNFLRVLDLYSD